jgi:hypothetical protein
MLRLEIWNRSNRLLKGLRSWLPMRARHAPLDLKTCGSGFKILNSLLYKMGWRNAQCVYHLGGLKMERWSWSWEKFKHKRVDNQHRPIRRSSDLWRYQ